MKDQDIAALLRAWTHCPTRLLPISDKTCCSDLGCSADSACMKTLGAVRIQTGSSPFFMRPIA